MVKLCRAISLKIKLFTEVYMFFIYIASVFSK